MVPFQVVFCLGGDLQQVQERHFGRLVLSVRFPELEELLHLVAIELHPLPTELDQGRLGVDELLPFLFGDELAPNRELIVIGDEGVETEVTRAVCGGAFGGPRCRLEADLRAPAPLGGPPGGDDHSVARVFEHPGAFLEEREGLIQGQAAAGRVGCGQPVPDLGIDPCGVPQGQQQILFEVLNPP